MIDNHSIANKISGEAKIIEEYTLLTQNNIGTVPKNKVKQDVVRAPYLFTKGLIIWK